MIPFDPPPPPVAQIDAQMSWESHCVSLGTVRHRTNESRRAVADRVGPKSFLTGLLGPLAESIEAAQAEARAIVHPSKGVGRKSTWHYLILYLPAHTLGLITLRTIVDNVFDHRAGYRVPRLLNLGQRIGSIAKLEVEFHKWRKNCAAAKQSGEAHYDLSAVVLKKLGQDLDTRQFRRLKRRLKDIEEVDWSTADRVGLGVKLLDLTARAHPKFFEISQLWLRGHTHATFVVTPSARARILTAAEHAEVAHPVLTPMICPPKPWRAE